MKVDTILEKHNWDVKLWLWAIAEIHFFVFLDNAWPSIREQESFTTQLLEHTPHKSDAADILSKVKYVGVISAYLHISVPICAYLCISSLTLTKFNLPVQPRDFTVSQ